MLHYDENLSWKFLRLNTINEIIVALEIFKNKKDYLGHRMQK